MTSSCSANVVTRPLWSKVDDSGDVLALHRQDTHAIQPNEGRAAQQQPCTGDSACTRAQYFGDRDDESDLLFSQSNAWFDTSPAVEAFTLLSPHRNHSILNPDEVPEQTRPI